MSSWHDMTDPKCDVLPCDESEKAYPTDERGLVYDFGAELADPKPCCKRITHENVSKYETSITWCTLPDGHAGQCSGPLPSILETDDLGPKRKPRRG